MFNQTLQSNITPNKLKEEWENLSAKGGSLQRIDNYKTEKQQNKRIVTARLVFSKLQLKQKFVYNDNDKIVNLETVSNTYGVKEEILKEAVSENILTFDGYNFPDEMINRLGQNKVIVFGEYHWVKESQELAGELFNRLNTHSRVNQILLEQPNGYSWRYNEYLNGDIINLPHNYLKTILDKIKEYKEKSGREVKVYCISTNKSRRQYVDNLSQLMDYLKIREDSILTKHLIKVKERLSDNKYREAVVSLNRDLTEKVTDYKNLLGDKYYIYVKSMTEAELDSIEYRKKKKVGYTESFICREELMKKLTDYYISHNDGKALIYIGFYHAQKKHYMGTEHEWLARYLKYASPYAKEETYALGCVPLKGTVNKDMQMNLLKYSQEHELFKVISKLNKKDKAFLSFDDNLFYNQDILVNYHFKKLAVPVGKQFDGFIIIPEASF